MVYCTPIAHCFTAIVRNRYQLPAFLFLLIVLPTLSQAGTDTQPIVPVPVSAVAASAEGVPLFTSPNVTIPDWGTVTLNPDRTHRAEGSTLWTGLLNDAESDDLVGTFALYWHVTGLVQGELYLGGRTLVLLPAYEAHGEALCLLSEQFEICSNNTLREVVIDSLNTLGATRTPAYPSPTQPTEGQGLRGESPCAECGDDGRMIDVLFLYTDNDLIWAGDDLALIQSRVDLAIDRTNDMLMSSEVFDMEYRCVGLEHIDYNEYDYDPTDHLDNIAYLPEAQSLRDIFNADLVCALLGDTDRSYGGFGYGIPGAYSVIRINTGVGVTFAHESGHNLGLSHYKFDPTVSPTEPVEYHFVSGHHWTGTDGTVFSTMMGNLTTEKTDIFVPRYSNPHVSFMGYPTGAPLETWDAAHSVLQLRLMARTVANYRQSGDIHDCDGDGVEDAIQIAADPQLDTNANGLIDSCERRLYVNTAAPAAGDGFDWASPRRELNSALLSTQRSCSLIKEVWVGQGTYVPDQGTGERNRRFQILRNCGLSVLGGFDGTETQVDQRDWVAHPTILSGEIGDMNIIEDNTYWLLNIVGVDGVTVDGFTVTRGAAVDPDNQGFGTGGGGIRIKNTSGHFANLFLQDNIATGWGGAVVAFDSRTLQFDDCVFADNTSGGLGGALDVRNATLLMNNCEMHNGHADIGGALSLRGDSIAIIQDSNLLGNMADNTAGAIWLDNNSQLDLVRCDLSGNVAGESGGALRLLNGSVANIEESTLSGNVSTNSSGGAINAWTSVNLSLARCQIENNFAAWGGGIIVGGGSTVDITDCSLIGNVATTGSGGGIRVDSSAFVIVTASRINNNSSQNGHGGGVFAINGSYIVLNSDTEIRNNTAIVGSGGGIRTFSNADLTIANCIIDSNQARYGGGVVLGQGTTTWIEDSMISANNALVDGHGGGIRTDAAESLTLIGTTIEGNTAAGVGGGLYSQNTREGFTLVIIQSTFRDNTATAFSGGAIRFAGANEYATALDIDQCLLIGNTANTNGGGLYITGTQATLNIDNSTIAANHAWNFGSSVYATNISSASMSNSIVTNVGSPNGAPAAFYTPGLNPDVQYSLTTLPGAGNVSDDPVFVDIESGDFRLAAGSPGIDAGSNLLVAADIFDLNDDGDIVEPLPVDLSGSIRFLDDEAVADTGVPGNGYDEIIDMGAFESAKFYCPADLNDDGVVNTLDFLLFLGAFASGDPLADWNRDGTVDTLDFLAYLNDFVAGC